MPLAKDDCLQHDSYYCIESGGIGFPVTRTEAGRPHDFVGRQCGLNDTGGDPDPTLSMRPFPQRYDLCLQLRRSTISRARGRGGSGSVTNKTTLTWLDINTPFKGKMTGSATDSWNKWLADISKTGNFGVAPAKWPADLPTIATIDQKEKQAAVHAVNLKTKTEELNSQVTVTKTERGQQQLVYGSIKKHKQFNSEKRKVIEQPTDKSPTSSTTREVKRWVVISTNENPFYTFFSPIVCWAWRHRIGIHPLLLVTSGVPNVVREASAWAGADVLEVPRGEWKKTSSLMQVARLAAASALTDDGDILTTTDVDIYPLKASFFQGIDLGAASIHVQGNHHDTLPNEYPICYVTMTVGAWKRVMHLPTTRDLSVPLKRMYHQGAKWNYDQEYLLNAIRNSAEEVKLYPWSDEDRMDLRSDRHAQFSSRNVDAHMLRPGFSGSNWPQIVDNLLRHAMDNETLSFFRSYRQRFVQQVMNGDESGKGLMGGMGLPEYLLVGKKT